MSRSSAEFQQKGDSSGMIMKNLFLLIKPVYTGWRLTLTSSWCQLETCFAGLRRVKFCLGELFDELRLDHTTTTTQPPRHNHYYHRDTTATQPRHNHHYHTTTTIITINNHHYHQQTPLPSTTATTTTTVSRRAFDELRSDRDYNHNYHNRVSASSLMSFAPTATTTTVSRRAL